MTNNLGGMIVLSGTSGAGKSSVINGLPKMAVKGLKQIFPKLRFSISATTRPIRSGEVHGREYYFKDVPDFEREVERGDFLEYAVVHDNYYGTPRGPIEEMLGQGVDVILDVDIQGWRQIREVEFKTIDRPQILSIFIKPPNIECLRERIERRQGATSNLDTRLNNAWHEIKEVEDKGEYDHVVINEEGRLHETITRIVSLIRRSGVLLNE